MPLAFVMRVSTHLHVCQQTWIKCTFIKIWILAWPLAIRSWKLLCIVAFGIYHACNRHICTYTFMENTTSYWTDICPWWKYADQQGQLRWYAGQHEIKKRNPLAKTQLLGWHMSTRGPTASIRVMRRAAQSSLPVSEVKFNRLMQQLHCRPQLTFGRLRTLFQYKGPQLDLNFISWSRSVQQTWR